MMLELMYRTLRLSAGIGSQLLRLVDEACLHVCACMRACAIFSELSRVCARIAHACVCLCNSTIRICFRMIQKPCQENFTMIFIKMLHLHSLKIVDMRCVCAGELVFRCFAENLLRHVRRSTESPRIDLTVLLLIQVLPSAHSAT